MPSNRKSAFLVCDDILFGMQGKAFPHGVYMSDIGITAEEFIAPQLAFLFLIELDVEDPCQEIKVRVELPNSAVSPEIRYSVRHPPFIEGRRTFTHKLPLLAQYPILTPGPINGLVSFGDQEVLAGQHWIVLSSPQSASAMDAPSLQKKRKK